MKALFISGALLTSGVGIAQSPTVDITVVAITDDTLELRVLRGTDTLDSLLAVTFTLGWDTAGDVHLGTPDQIGYGGPPFCEFMALPTSPNGDGEVDVDGVRHATYNAITGAAIPPGCGLQANVEYPFVRIPVLASNGACVNINVVNDAYTAANNKDFFFSTGGSDRTGTIYGPGALDMGDCSTGTTELPTPAITLSPNPANDVLLVRMGNAPLRGWRIVDASGRTMAASEVNAARMRTEIPLTGLPAGAYLLVVNTDNGLLQERFVISR